MNTAPLLAYLDDRLPPVLVKELRQALRAKAFLGSFVVALALALLVTWRWSMGQGGEPGGAMLVTILLGVLMLPAGLLVPFSAFQSMSSEWEQGTVEQLQLSTLSPLSLAVGKLLSALSQLLLFTCAFLPFVALASIAGGVGIGQIVYGLTNVFGASFALTCWGLALGTFGKNRLARTVMMLLLFMLGFMWMQLPLMLFMGTFGPGAMVGTGVGAGVGAPRAALGMLLGTSLLPGVAGLAVAATRLAHPATNTSTPLRWAATVCLGLGLLLATTVAHGGGMNQLEYGGLLGTLAALLSGCAIFFTTEPERLSRPVVTRLLARRIALPFHGFWLPGGGRGVAWFWLHGAMLVGLGSIFGVGLPPAFSRSSSGIDVVSSSIGVLCLASAYVLLPGTLLVRWNRTRLRRALLRWIPVVAVLGGLVLSTMLSLFSTGWPDTDFMVSPFWLLSRVRDDGLASGVGIAVLAIGGSCTVLSLPRAAAGMREVRTHQPHGQAP